jgi:hypothetical protein
MMYLRNRWPWTALVAGGWLAALLLFVRFRGNEPDLRL